MSFDKPNKQEFDRSKEAHSFELWEKCFKEAEVGDFYPTIERNEKGEILAPNGLPSRLPNEDFVKVTRTPTFKEWFGDWVNEPENSSKVVYEDTGEPMVLYHSTEYYIPVEEGLLPKFTYSYFTDNLKFSGKYGNSKFSVFLRLDHPGYIRVYSNRVNRWTRLVETQKKSDFEFHDGFIKEIGSSNDSFIYSTHESTKYMHLPSDITRRK